MANKLLHVAQDHWRRISSLQLIALVRVGVEYTGGQQIERRKHLKGRRLTIRPDPQDLAISPGSARNRSRTAKARFRRLALYLFVEVR